MHPSVLRLKVGKEKLGTMLMPPSSAKNSSCKHSNMHLTSLGPCGAFHGQAAFCHKAPHTSCGLKVGGMGIEKCALRTAWLAADLLNAPARVVPHLKRTRCSEAFYLICHLTAPRIFTTHHTQRSNQADSLSSPVLISRSVMSCH